MRENVFRFVCMVKGIRSKTRVAFGCCGCGVRPDIESELPHTPLYSQGYLSYLYLLRRSQRRAFLCVPCFVLFYIAQDRPILPVVAYSCGGTWGWGSGGEWGGVVYRLHRGEILERGNGSLSCPEPTVCCRFVVLCVIVYPVPCAYV